MTRALAEESPHETKHAEEQIQARTAGRDTSECHLSRGFLTASEVGGLTVDMVNSARFLAVFLAISRSVAAGCVWVCSSLVPRPLLDCIHVCLMFVLVKKCS